MGAGKSQPQVPFGRVLIGYWEFSLEACSNRYRELEGRFLSIKYSVGYVEIKLPLTTGRIVDCGLVSSAVYRLRFIAENLKLDNFLASPGHLLVPLDPQIL